MQNLDFYTSSVTSFSGYSKPLEDARYVIVGVPYDHTSTYRSGSRFGPNAIREASWNIETYSLRARIDVENVPMHDAGDLHIVDELTETCRRLEKVVADIFSAGKMPICIGGEHSISLGPIRALPKSTAIVSFDAHGDLRDEYGGGKFSHATILRRATELVGAKAVMVCGVRALCKEEVDFIEAEKVRHLTPWEIRKIGLADAGSRISSFLKDFEHVYLTIDTDVLDPGYAPGVSNPEFEGLTPDELVYLASIVARERMVAFDLVEVCPNYDSGITAAAAARIIFEVIAQRESVLQV